MINGAYQVARTTWVLMMKKNFVFVVQKSKRKCAGKHAQKRAEQCAEKHAEELAEKCPKAGR